MRHRSAAAEMEPWRLTSTSSRRRLGSSASTMPSAKGIYAIAPLAAYAAPSLESPAEEPEPWPDQPHRRRRTRTSTRCSVRRARACSVSTRLGRSRRWRRPAPPRAQSAMAAGALLIDIRSEAERHSDGVAAGALVIERNVLEWRCDPDCAWRDPRIAPARRLIVMCNEGYQSSLAAA